MIGKFLYNFRNNVKARANVSAYGRSVTYCRVRPSRTQRRVVCSRPFALNRELSCPLEKLRQINEPAPTLRHESRGSHREDQTRRAVPAKKRGVCVSIAFARKAQTAASTQLASCRCPRTRRRARLPTISSCKTIFGTSRCGVERRSSIPSGRFDPAPACVKAVQRFFSKNSVGVGNTRIGSALSTPIRGDG